MAAATEAEAGVGVGLFLLTNKVMYSPVSLPFPSFPEVRWNNMISSGEGSVLGSDVCHVSLSSEKAPVGSSRLSPSLWNMEPQDKVTESPHGGQLWVSPDLQWTLNSCMNC